MSTKPGPCAFCVVDECGHVCTRACDKSPTPTRTEFEAAAYRWWREWWCNTEVLPPIMSVKTEAELDTAIAAAMGWPAVPEQAGWLPIESAPEGVPCVVFWREDGEGAESERYEFDWIEDGIWQNHSEHHENYLMVGGPSMGPGPKERPPYTHFRPLLPPAPTVPEVKS